jgi:hypothetical protein
MLDASHIDCLIAVGVADEVEMLDDSIGAAKIDPAYYTSYGIGVYDDTEFWIGDDGSVDFAPDGAEYERRRYAPQNGAVARALSLHPIPRSYKPTCAYGRLGMWLCVVCVHLGHDMRRDFCPIGEMW